MGRRGCLHGAAPWSDDTSRLRRGPSSEGAPRERPSQVAGRLPTSGLDYQRGMVGNETVENFQSYRGLMSSPERALCRVLIGLMRQILIKQLYFSGSIKILRI